MRLAILHTRLAPYFVACLLEFRRQGGQIMIYARRADSAAPFERTQFGNAGEIHNRDEALRETILGKVKAFKPDAVLVAGWADRDYLAVCRSMRAEGVPVISGCDTQWTGSLRQHIAGWTSPWHVGRAINALWVSGERQAVLGRALGFSGDQLWDGYYACDWPAFGGRRPGTGDTGQGTKDRETMEGSSAFNIPHATLNIQSSCFLYVGRYVPEKGIDTLAKAYKKYCTLVEKPWRLVCAGAGPLRRILMEAGAEDRGFVQPSELPRVMAGAGAFVLPSRFEPWGVVVQEAAAGGLPLICSDACGAAVHLLRDGFNGFLFPAGDVNGLVRSMVAMHRLKEPEREAYGQASFELSKQYTPERWAKTLVEGLKRLRTQESETGGRRPELE